VALLSFAQRKVDRVNELQVVASINNIINVNIDSAHLQTSLCAVFGRTHHFHQTSSQEQHDQSPHALLSLYVHAHPSAATMAGPSGRGPMPDVFTPENLAQLEMHLNFDDLFKPGSGSGRKKPFTAEQWTELIENDTKMLGYHRGDAVKRATALRVQNAKKTVLETDAAGQGKGKRKAKAIEGDESSTKAVKSKKVSRKSIAAVPKLDWSRPVDEQAIEEAIARPRHDDPESRSRAIAMAKAYTFDPRPRALGARLAQRREIVLGSGLQSQAMQTIDRPNSSLTPSKVAVLADTAGRNKESTIGEEDVRLDVKELFRQLLQVRQQTIDDEVKNNPEEVASLLEKIDEIRRQIKEAQRASGHAACDRRRGHSP
jgi:hypothetical protein